MTSLLLFVGDIIQETFEEFTEYSDCGELCGLFINLLPFSINMYSFFSLIVFFVEESCTKEGEYN